MKINIEGLRDRSKMHFLIIETWQGMDPAASYAEQANAVRRSLDALAYIENAFAKGPLVMAHKEASSPTTYQIVAVNNNEELNDYIKGNAAHVRVRPDLRKVIPLCDWEAGKETFLNTIRELERLSGEEEKYLAEKRFRPIE
jgi:hypothetical protein